MVGPVDHELRADFWQRDKWPGCFKVRWHLVKDVPNSALRHIRLVQGDKKPVTNSRDAQEVEPSQGMLVLNVFREFRAATTLLDDFEFFGRREKVRASLRRMRDACGGGHPADGRTPFHPADGRTPFHPTGSPAASEFYPGWTRASGFQPVPFQRPPPATVDTGRARVKPPDPDPRETPAVETGSHRPSRETRAETPPMRRKTRRDVATPSRSTSTRRRSPAATKNRRARRRRRRYRREVAAVPVRGRGRIGECVRRVTIAGFACRSGFPVPRTREGRRGPGRRKKVRILMKKDDAGFELVSDAPGGNARDRTIGLWDEIREAKPGRREGTRRRADDDERAARQTSIRGAIFCHS